MRDYTVFFRDHKRTFDVLAEDQWKAKRCAIIHLMLVARSMAEKTNPAKG